MQNRYFIGLMSGTSMDGIDAVLVDFEQKTPVQHHYYRPYSKTLKQNLSALLSSPHSLEVIGECEQALSCEYAQCVLSLLEQTNLKAKDIIAIGNHGQTVLHRPEKGISWQLGNSHLIRQRTNITTISDFRRQDIAQGGQGAPMAPVFHASMLNQAPSGGALINIGGISNISFIDPKTKTVCGYDIGPGNTLMDQWVQQHLHTDYDEKGQWAKGGTICQDLLEALYKDPYFSQAAPKSTGREYFHLLWLKRHLESYQKYSAQWIQATLCALSAYSIAQALKQQNIKQAYIAGGGWENTYLIQLLEQYSSPCIIESSRKLGIDPKHLEAYGMAYLAKKSLDQSPQKALARFNGVCYL